MILRVLVLSLFLSMNAYAKPSHHKVTFPDNKNTPSPQTTKPSEDDLSSQLTSHGWQIAQIPKQQGITLDDEYWYFNFAANGKYKAFGSCNYVGGNYKVDSAGTFRISNLDGSNNRCEDGKDDEAAVFNMLLLADSFEINGEGLSLKSSGQTLISFKASDKIVDVNAAHKSRAERKLGKSHSKSAEKSAHKKSGKSKAKSSPKNNSKPQAKTAAKKTSTKHHSKK